MGGYAWVTLATNDSYSLGALVLAHSLKQVATREQLVVLITPGVTPPMRTKLAEVFDVVQEVNILDSKDESNLKLLKRPELGVTFTKLHCWRLTQFEKCVFLDADTLVLENCDELFEREEFSAAPDIGWPDCFNSGVFVFRPSTITYDKLIQFALEKGSFDGGDQGLLNLFFSDWAHGDITKHLPFIYNMSSTATYSYLPAFKQFGSKAKIIHFLGATKPWLQYFDTESRTVHPSDEVKHLQGILQHWWNIFCNNIHPGLSSDMNIPSIPTPHSKHYGSHSNIQYSPTTTYNPQHSLSVQEPPIITASFIDSHQIYEQNICDPWEEYDSKFINETQTTETIPDPINIIASNISESSCSHIENSTTQSILNNDSKLMEEHIIHNYVSECDNSNNDVKQNENIESHNTNAYNNNDNTHQNIPSIENIDTSSITTHFNPSPSTLSSSPVSNIESPSSPEIPVPSATRLPDECLDTATIATTDNKLYASSNEDSNENVAGIAGAFAKLSLGVPRTPEQAALDDHLRRQGWEVGNIDYLGRDSFENIWSKICQTLSTTSDQQTAPVPLGGAEGPESDPKIETSSLPLSTACSIPTEKTTDSTLVEKSKDPLKVEVLEKEPETDVKNIEQTETSPPTIKSSEGSPATCPISTPKQIQSPSVEKSVDPVAPALLETAPKIPSETASSTMKEEEVSTCPIQTQKPSEILSVVESKDLVLPLSTGAPKTDAKIESKTVSPPIKPSGEAPACPISTQKPTETPPVMESKDAALSLTTGAPKKDAKIESKTVSPPIESSAEAPACPISTQKPTETPPVMESKDAALSLTTGAPKKDAKIESKTVSPPIESSEEAPACPISTQKPTGTPPVLELKDPALSLTTGASKTDAKIESKTVSPPIESSEEAPACPISTQKPTGTPPVLELKDPALSLTTGAPKTDAKIESKTVSPPIESSEEAPACPISTQKPTETPPVMESKDAALSLTIGAPKTDAKIESKTVSPPIESSAEAPACPISTQKPTEVLEADSKVQSKTASPPTKSLDEAPACPISKQEPTETSTVVESKDPAPLLKSEDLKTQSKTITSPETHPVVESKDHVLPPKTEVPETGVKIQSQATSAPIKSSEDLPACPISTQKSTGTLPLAELKDPVLPLKTESPVEEPTEIKSPTASPSLKSSEDVCQISAQKPAEATVVEKSKDQVLPSKTDVPETDRKIQSKSSSPLEKSKDPAVAKKLLPKQKNRLRVVELRNQKLLQLLRKLHL